VAPSIVSEKHEASAAQNDAAFEPNILLGCFVPAKKNARLEQKNYNVAQIYALKYVSLMTTTS